MHGWYVIDYNYTHLQLRHNHVSFKKMTMNNVRMINVKLCDYKVLSRIICGYLITEGYI